MFLLAIKTKTFRKHPQSQRQWKTRPCKLCKYLNLNFGHFFRRMSGGQPSNQQQVQSGSGRWTGRYLQRSQKVIMLRNFYVQGFHCKLELCTPSTCYIFPKFMLAPTITYYNILYFMPDTDQEFALCHVTATCFLNSQQSLISPRFQLACPQLHMWPHARLCHLKTWFPNLFNHCTIYIVQEFEF